MISPKRGNVRSMSLEAVNTCCRSHEFRLVANHAIVKISPISPTRL